MPIAVALAATAILLSACGGWGDSSRGNDKITGADEGDTKDTVSPSASASGSAKRPTITLPSDVKNVFENWKTGDATKDALMSDVQERINATDAAITDADPGSAALTFYYRGEALAGAAEWVQGYVDDGKSITGTVRFYKPDLLMVDKNTAALAYCADESRAFDKDRKSNTVEKTPVTKNSYVAYNTRLQKNELGVWQTTRLLSVRRNGKCTP
ncbi:hypothetical protein AB0K80_04270 [Streptomyces sp. NPDC052682]|uniref:hypothetical protein n=1 Tax=Streptomyces sp. NPDC052682 TaxID=3154954 RepID=UPI0034373C4F